MLAPIRSPVNEPGPDMKVILVISCQFLWFSFSLSLIKPRSFSAKELANVCEYSLSSSLKIVVSVDVSKYKFMI